jgi:hypothetical protein
VARSGKLGTSRKNPQAHDEKKAGKIPALSSTIETTKMTNNALPFVGASTGSWVPLRCQQEIFQPGLERLAPEVPDSMTL